MPNFPRTKQILRKVAEIALRTKPSTPKPATTAVVPETQANLEEGGTVGLDSNDADAPADRSEQPQLSNPGDET